MLIPTEVVGLDPTEMPIALRLAGGGCVKASTVVVATGARYRRLDVPNLGDFEGRGVWYWASPIEARLCRNQEIVLVGGGNSAGQAAVFLRSFAAKIWMLVRGPSLAESMSQYLVERIRAIDNIELLTHTEIVALYGSREKQLECVCWRNNLTGEQTEKPIRHVFLFIGADPATTWLRDSEVALDTKNYILTGTDVPSDARRSNNGSARPLALETSVRGCSLPAMCGPDRSSGWEPQSARARLLERSYMPFLKFAKAGKVDFGTVVTATPCIAPNSVFVNAGRSGTARRG
jgi:thioredoxin reductase (NADPH)